MQKDIGIRDQMFSMISLWQQSGLTQKTFCEQHDIRYHVFHYWYKYFRDQSHPGDEGFIPLKIQPCNSENTSCPYIELQFADGKRLLFHQAVSSDYLKALIS